MAAQVRGAQRVLHHLARRRGIFVGGAVLRHVEREVAIARLHPDQDLPQAVGIDLPADPRALDVRDARPRRAHRQIARVVPRHAAAVVVHAEKVDRLPDQLEVALVVRGPIGAEALA